MNHRLSTIIAFIWLAFASPLLNAQTSLLELDLELSEQAQEAVDNGVSLTIDCLFADIDTFLFLDLERNPKEHRFTLARHALSNRYIVKRDDLTRPYIFNSISEATHYISGQAINLLEFYSTTNPHRQMRLSLNKYELPGPMRLQAFLFDEWDLDTGWLAWAFES